MKAIVKELIGEEIIYGNAIIVNINSDNPTREVLRKYLPTEHLYLTKSGKKLKRSAFAPLIKHAVVIDNKVEKIVGQLQYNDQPIYNVEDEIEGTVAKVPARVRQNDGVYITDTEFLNNNDIVFRFGVVSSVHETSMPSGCAIRFPDGDYVIVPRRSFIITTRPNIIRVFNIKG